MINYASVMYSLLLSSSAIALAQIPATPQPHPLKHSKLLQPEALSGEGLPRLAAVSAPSGKPGVPRRRVGGGTRLY